MFCGGGKIQCRDARRTALGEAPQGAAGTRKRLLAGRHETGTMSDDGRGQTASWIPEDRGSEDAAAVEVGGLPG